MPKSLAASGNAQQQLSLGMPKGCCLHRQPITCTSRGIAAMALAATCSSRIRVNMQHDITHYTKRTQQQQSTPNTATTRSSLAPHPALLYSSSSSSRSGRHCRYAAADPITAAAAADLSQLVYTDPSVSPDPFVGPIAAALIPGKGRGLVATEPLRPGQLLLVTPPLVLVEGDLGEIPEHDELVECVYEGGLQLSPWQAQWLKALICSVDNNTSSDSSNGQDSSRQGSSSSSSSSSSVVNVPDMLPPKGGWWSAAAAASSNNSAAKTFAELSLDMTEEELWGAVVLNCYGEGFQDLPASLSAGAAVSSQLGLWGPFALLNHSCCPSAVNYTLRDRMVVRAAAATAAGDEITINYLGRGSLRPLSQRQEELEACYGFKCNCDRCQTEVKLSGLPTAAGNTLGGLLDQIQQKIGTEFDPQLQQLTSQQQQQQEQEQEDDQRQEQLLLLAAAMQQDWDDLLSVFNSNTASDLGLPATAATAASACTRASAFDLLGLLQEALAAANEPDDDVITSLVQVCEAICPGSDLTVFQALRRVSLTQQRQGPGSVGAQQAMVSLVYALRVRYGDQVVEDHELLKRMVTSATEAAAMVSF